MHTLADFSARSIEGQDIDLADYLGQVVLVVNTASKCGLTPQFEGLQSLYDRFGEQGFTVLGFPCDQFRDQELDDDAEIAGFCQRNYGVSFPMFSKIDVNGEDAHPLYRWLRTEQKGVLSDRIKWNFTKFLLDRDGKVVARYSPTTKPEKIAADIERALAAPRG
ncbi:glutathione peroxidase [Nocardioides ochotonae]|uniref:glutathione peroxidase n=1 Tax=Nocardioides ochotonae TaxID=2685869 RepID=UPI00140E5DFC|nr:glutathione peroxidase [Nocardioides ochotonae]